MVNVVVDPLGQDGSGIVDLLRRARIPGVDALGQVGIRGVHALDQGGGDLVTVVVDSNQPLLYAVVRWWGPCTSALQRHIRGQGVSAPGWGLAFHARPPSHHPRC